jgi:CheY-like chemotaxis protein
MWNAGPPIPAILVVDDTLSVRMLLAEIIVRIYPAVTVTAVRNGAAALREVGWHAVDLIITNQHMPVLDGLTVIRTLRAHHVAIPILMVSGDLWVADAARAAGATSFLAKPFTVPDLHAALQAVLPRQDGPTLTSAVGRN